MLPARARRLPANSYKPPTNMSARSARIVLVDDAEVRATMTASWLRQMGWQDVFVLTMAGMESGWLATPTLEPQAAPNAAIDLAGFVRLFAHNAATIIELSGSPNYLEAHILGAWFAIRGRLDRPFKKIPVRETVVLTSEDGTVARLAVGEVRGLVDNPVHFLVGGNAAWRTAGCELAAEPLMADEAVD